jgi:hypothetical protein
MRTTLFALSSFLVAAVAACSEAPPEAPASSDAEIHTGGICSTLDYGPTLAPDQYYQVFESKEKAAEWVGHMLEQQPDAGTLKEVTDDARLNRLVGEVFEGFKHAFPRETAGLPPTPPRVVILEKDQINAFAMGPISIAGAPAKSPWLFFVNTKLLLTNAADNELRGVFAHELGHLIIRTFLPEVAGRVRSFYMINGSENGVLGEAQDTNPAIQAHIEDILKHQLRVGGIPNLAMPVLYSLNPPTYLNMIKSLAATGAHQPSAPPGCARVDGDLKALKDAQVALLPGKEEGLLMPRAPTAEESSRLELAAKAVSDDFHACFDGETDQPPFLAMLAMFNGLPPQAADPSNPQHEDLVKLALPVELRIDSDMPGASLAEKIFRADVMVRAELDALQKDPAFPIEKLRVYDSEEDADDASIRVLSAIGQDPTGVGQFFVHHFMPSDAIERCNRALAAGESIPYGNLIDTHPATCWRYYHATQFASALAQCTTAPTTVRASKGSGLPSVLEQMKPERGFESYDKKAR